MSRKPKKLELPQKKKLKDYALLPKKRLKNRGKKLSESVKKRKPRPSD